MVLRSEIASAKDEIKYSLPFADYNPYTGVCIWGREKTTSPAVDTYNRVNKWEPDGLLLTESIAGRTIRLNRDERGYEINLKPGTDLSFINLVEADFEMEGWDTYHLPVYEEALLIEDHRRFILIDHNVSDSAITHKSEFVFPDSPQQ